MRLYFFFYDAAREQLAGGVPSPPPPPREQIFKGLPIDAAVIAAVLYLNGRTTSHLISMTFHRQPSVPRPRAAARERERER